MNSTLIYIIHIRNTFRIKILIYFFDKTLGVRSGTKDEKRKTKEGRSKRQDPETSLLAGQAGSG